MNPRLSLVTVLTLLVVGSFALGLLRGARPTPDEPRGGFVGIEPAELDLGTYLWGETVPFELTFINRSREPITLVDGRSSCGCTLLNKDGFVGATVGPDTELIIEGMIDVQMIPGAFARRVDLVTDTDRTYSAVVHLEVVGTWTLAPDVLDFGELVIDADTAPVADVLTFQAAQEELLDVTALSAPWLSVHRADRNGDRTDILVRVYPERLPPGQHSAEVTVRTTCAVHPTGRVFVKARGVHGLETRPASVLRLRTSARGWSSSVEAGFQRASRQ